MQWAWGPPRRVLVGEIALLLHSATCLILYALHIFCALYCFKQQQRQQTHFRFWGKLGKGEKKIPAVVSSVEVPPQDCCKDLMRRFMKYYCISAWTKNVPTAHSLMLFGSLRPSCGSRHFPSCAISQQSCLWVIFPDCSSYRVTSL